MKMNYKAAHESFVSGGEGSTHFHIAVTVLAAIITPHLRDVLHVLFPGLGTVSAVSRFLLDMLLIVMPLQLVMTVFNQASAHIFWFEIFLMTVLCWWYLRRTGNEASSNNKITEEIAMRNRRPFITYFRAFVNLLTAFSILAVDFKIFPRYFAKAETYGTGLMDVGVGCFMIANAIVSPEARGIVTEQNPMTAILKSVKSSVPLWVLGCLRVVAVKTTNYQEHVTEYGVHWNFFFTLAAVKILVAVMISVVPKRFWNMASVGVIAVYQHSLTYDGLKDYIIKGVDGKGGRHGFIDANREGLYSCAGYLSLYIFGVQLGKLLMTKREKVSDWIKLCIHLTMVTVGTWILLYFCEKHVEPVSRRFANLAYILWMLALNSLFLLTFLIFDILTFCMYTMDNSAQRKTGSTDNKPQPPDEVCFDTSDLMYAINYNGLAYFLLANLLTGLVNMSVQTIYQPTLVALAILTLYMFVLNSLIVYLYHKKISLKVW